MLPRQFPDGLLAKFWEGVGRKGIDPLVGVLGVLSVVLVGRVVLLGTFLEATALPVCIKALRVHASLFLIALVDGVNAIVHKLTVLFGALAGFSQRPVGQRAETHVAFSLVQGVAQNPGLATKATDLEVQPAAVVIEARLAEIFDLNRRQTVACFTHCQTFRVI